MRKPRKLASPDSAGAFADAAALYDCKRYAEALQVLNALDGSTSEPPAIAMLAGRILFALRRCSEALEKFSSVLVLRPDSADAHLMRANCLKYLGRNCEAIQSYIEAERCAPGLASALILHESARRCDWPAVERWKPIVLNQIIRDGKPVPPFVLLGHVDDPELQLTNARLWARTRFERQNDRASGVASELVSGDPNPKPKVPIRIGYYSADFHGHATTSLISELIELHDRAKFTVFGFSYGPPKLDQARKRIEQAFDSFLDVHSLSDEEIRALSHKHKIDIAVDLKGYTTDHRISIFIKRVAPIQIAYLGYPGTTGARNIDYLITDSVVTPEGFDKYYSEKLIRLPICYQVNDRKRASLSGLVSRAEFGFSDKEVILASFNNTYKITDEVFVCWMEILEKVSEARLWILADDEVAIENIRRRVRDFGLAEKRVIFAPRVAEHLHLRRLQVADLFLDTFPCNAHTTASDAMLCKVPLVTIQGRSFASRVAASILTAVGMEELITSNLESYKKKILLLTQSPEKLNELKQRLSDKFKDSALYQPQIFVQHFENALMETLVNEAVAGTGTTLQTAEPFPTLEGLLGLGSRLYRSGCRSAALSVYQFGLELFPYSDKLLINAGVMCKELGLYDQAQLFYKQYLSRNNKDPLPYLYLANLLRQAGQNDEAHVYISYCVALDPDNAVARTVEGAILFDRSSFAEATHAFKEALRISPKNAQAAEALVKCLLRLRDYDAALEFITSGFEGQRTPELQRALSEIFFAIGDFGAALSSYLTIPEVSRTNPEYLLLGCNIFRKLGRDAEALKLLESIDHRKLNGKNSNYLLGNVLFLRRKLAIWEGEDDLIKKLRVLVEAGRPVMAPFIAVAMIDDWKIQQAAAQIYVRGLTKNITKTTNHPIVKVRSERLTVAYFSADFYDHATSHLISGLIKSHDRTKFSIIGCNLGRPIIDWKYKQLHEMFDVFYEFGQYDDDRIVEFCRERRFDIAIDLKGYTFDSRPTIFAKRVAGIQIAYLGYPGTMGAEFIDYVILDRNLVDPQDEVFFDERILYMPECYQANDDERLESSNRPTREQYGLSDNRFVFSSFNNVYKVNNRIFSVWMEILKSVPESQLWLLCPDNAVREKFRARASDCGLEANRLVFADSLTSEEHLARLPLADLMLDTFPCTAHTTTSDALWMGLPVLTCRGNTMVARVASSLLIAAGLNDLVTASLDEYRSKAIALATAPMSERALLRSRVKQARTSPVYDRIRFTRDFEAILEHAFRQ